MNTNQQQHITIGQNFDLANTLFALDIPHTMYDDEGRHLMRIVLSHDADQRLLHLWTAITDLRFRYIEAQQRTQATQLQLPMEDSDG